MSDPIEVSEVEPELTELSLRYTGTSDSRVMTQKDLSGVAAEEPLPDLVWHRGGVVPFSTWEKMAGSPARAREVLMNQAHEFELVGPGVEDFEWEEDAEEDDGTEV